jgi:hypothetical protein
MPDSVTPVGDGTNPATAGTAPRIVGRVEPAAGAVSGCRIERHFRHRGRAVRARFVSGPSGELVELQLFSPDHGRGDTHRWAGEFVRLLDAAVWELRRMVEAERGITLPPERA